MFFGSELEVRELVLVEGVKLRNEHKIRTTRMNSRSTLGLRGKRWGIGIKGWGPQQVWGEGCWEGWNNEKGVGLQELGAENKGLRVVMGEGYKANESKSFQKPSSVNNERISFVVILESSTNL